MQQQVPSQINSSVMSTLSSSVVPIPPQAGQQQAPPSVTSGISMKPIAPQQITSSYTLQPQQQQQQQQQHQQQQQQQTHMQSLPIRAYLDQTVVPLLLDGTQSSISSNIVQFQFSANLCYFFYLMRLNMLCTQVCQNLSRNVQQIL